MFKKTWKGRQSSLKKTKQNICNTNKIHKLKFRNFNF